MKNLLLLIFLFIQTLAYSQTVFFSFGSSWKYKDDGSNQGASWQQASFNDSGWQTGLGKFGYGYGCPNPNTLLTILNGCGVVNPCPTCTNKYITTYFRRSVNIPDVSLYQSFTFQIYRDDGIVVYVNGTEVVRNNMTSGGINSSTTATSTITNDGFITFTVPSSTFQNGNNVIAVELHQVSQSSSDAFFDMQLLGAPITLSSFFTYGSIWKYKDDGSNQNTAWQATSFDDSGWMTGAGKLGYPANRVTTEITCGASPPTCATKYITYYFRKKINITDITLYQSFKFQFYRDDGIVVYVNGSEVFRDNMGTTDPVNYLTTATNASDDGNTIFTKSVSSTAFQTGDNVIAVEVHQSSVNSSDLIFDMELLGLQYGYVELVRGPYLQKPTPTSMMVRWRTNQAVASKVSYGLTSDNLSQSQTISGTRTEHSVQLTGLTPYTKYYYSVETSSLILESSEQNYFLTSPSPGQAGKYTFWVVGDAGNATSNQRAVRDRYYSYIGSNITNGWLLLGDNAYENGCDQEYTDNFFNQYKDGILKKTPLLPTPGNHEYYCDDGVGASPRQDLQIPYFDAFDLPTNGDAGGVASNTEAYYSYDYGNIHFVSLDSYATGVSGELRLEDPNSAQVTWLKQDLAANTKLWTIVYFHHPPYSMGSHNSDTEGDLKAIRENFIPILEQYKVDVVMSGHSHLFERSKSMKGHYGLETTYNPSIHTPHPTQQSSGRYDGTANSCPYLKDNLNTQEGTVYVVSGSAGELDSFGELGSGYPHDAMTYSDYSEGGSFVLEVEGNRLDGKWLAADGVIYDKFTIFKNASKVTNLTVNAGESVTLKAEWDGQNSQYLWPHSNETMRSVAITPMVNGVYTVRDANNCITNTFNITVTPLPVELVSFKANADDENITLTWKTASELNNDFFEVQRFTSPEEIEVVGSVKGKGTTSVANSYKFVDYGPLPGNSYYRLKQVDYDGGYELSSVVQVYFEGKASISLVPNPNHGSQLGISTVSYSGPILVAIYDAQGRSISSHSTSVNPVSPVTFIDLRYPLSSGIYFVRIQGNSFNVTKKLVVN